MASEPTNTAPAGMWDWAYTHAAPIWQKYLKSVYGEEFITQIHNLSYITQESLEWLETHLRLEPGMRLLDAGCGEGGPGMWIASRTGSVLTGLDLSGVAIAGARRWAQESGASASFKFLTGDIAHMPFGTAEFDRVMSVDSIHLAPVPGLHEIARVLAPGGILALTSWEATADLPELANWPRDFRTLLDDTGFSVTDYMRSETEQSTMKAFCDLVAGEMTTSRDLPPDIREPLRQRAVATREMADHGIRILVAAQRR